MTFLPCDTRAAGGGDTLEISAPQSPLACWSGVGCAAPTVFCPHSRPAGHGIYPAAVGAIADFFAGIRKGGAFWGGGAAGGAGAVGVGKDAKEEDLAEEAEQEPEQTGVMTKPDETINPVVSAGPIGSDRISLLKKFPRGKEHSTTIEAPAGDPRPSRTADPIAQPGARSSLEVLGAVVCFVLLLRLLGQT